MADASGTPTNPDGIPTYNTSVDPPSGLGFNTAMAAIQTALSARISKPAGIVSGEVPVWNGTGWDRSSVTRVGASSLGSGTPDATKFLRGDGSWQVVSTAVEAAYAQVTAPTSITGTTQAAATTVVTAPAFTADGLTTYLVQFYAELASTANAIGVGLWLDGTQLWGQAVLNSSAVNHTIRLTPASGSRTYSFRAWDSGGSGTIRAGTGAAGASSSPPAFIRVSKAA